MENNNKFVFKIYDVSILVKCKISCYVPSRIFSQESRLRYLKKNYRNWDGQKYKMTISLVSNIPNILTSNNNIHIIIMLYVVLVNYID